MKTCSGLNSSLDSVHKGEDRDGILSTTEEPETNAADSFDGSGVVAAAVSSDYTTARVIIKTFITSRHVHCVDIAIG